MGTGAIRAERVGKKVRLGARRSPLGWPDGEGEESRGEVVSLLQA